MKIVTASANRLGNRASNQDRCLVEQLPGHALLAVADGMGGHDRGELAAQVTVDSLARRFRHQTLPIADPRRFLEQALHSAHLDVVDAGRSHHPPITPRTTCVVCLVRGDRTWWAHVGDSRLYLLRDGALLARTRDHTPVEELLQGGMLTEEELRTHPLRNSVSRCLGGPPRLPKISLGDATLRRGDTLLLCSDGLWSALPEPELVALCANGDLERHIERLADAAEAASYPNADNISAVALRWLDAGDRSVRGADSGPDRETPPAPARDPLAEAIDNIHRAMIEYASEMKK